MSVAATLSDHLVESVPGDETAISVRVLNDGDTVDELDVDVVGEPAGWTRVVPQRLFLLPGESAVASVVFAPPRSPAVRAGVRHFGVRVRSRGDPEAATVEEGTATVARYDDVAVLVRPRLRRARGRADYAVEVDNAGNAPAEVRLDGADDEEALRYAFSARQFDVEPGVRAGVRLRVRPRHRLLTGPPAVRPFAVRAWHAGAAEPVASDAAHVQRPLVPAWAIRVALLAVLVGALLLALAAASGRFPRRPATSARVSTATEERAQAAARTAQRAAAAAQQQAAAAQRQAAAAAERLGRAERQLASPPPGPLTTPYGAALTIRAARVAGRPGRGAFEWPEEAGLALTDLVLTNRAGDTVDVRVLRDGQVLFQLYVDSAEPRSLAFATPVRFGERGTFTVEVTCVATTAAGTPPECVPVVYAGGFLT